MCSTSQSATQPVTRLIIKERKEMTAIWSQPFGITATRQFYDCRKHLKDTGLEQSGISPGQSNLIASHLKQTANQMKALTEALKKYNKRQLLFCVELQRRK